MDHMITAIIDGKERPLNYSVEIMFKVNEKFGGVNQALDVINSETKEGLDSLRWLAIELANDGELCRREKGLDHLPFLTPKDLSARMSPISYILLRGRVMDAIRAGYKRETENEDEIDLGLAELNEKKAPAGA